VTTALRPTALLIDKFEMSLRLGENNFVTLRFFEDILRDYVQRGEALYGGRIKYSNNRRGSKLHTIYLLPDRRCNLAVEMGVATDRNGRHYPYVKFSFNVQRLSSYPDAGRQLRVVLSELSSNGGDTNLLDDGYVLYAEFSADFRGVSIESIDAYHPTLDTSLYFFRNSEIKTINLHGQRPGRPEAFCIYDKALADREKSVRIRRGPFLRIESKRRFNRTPTYQQLQLEGLHSIPNPFRELRIYDREAMESTFTAARHKSFLTKVRQQGVQAALAGTRGADRDRRERMLDEHCRVDWWDPERTWAGRHHAINAVRALLGGSLYTIVH